MTAAVLEKPLSIVKELTEEVLSLRSSVAKITSGALVVLYGRPGAVFVSHDGFAPFPWLATLFEG